jgi:flagellar protein FliS
MSINNPYQKYQENSILTAPPAELTLMLYNGCLKFISLAKIAIEKNDMEAKQINITKAQRIIAELMATLKMEYDIAKDMYRLYDYIRRRLIIGNIKNDLEILTEVEGLVKNFRDPWKEAMKIAKQK